MERSKEIHEWIDTIRLADEGFRCDEETIAKEAARSDALFSNIGIKALSVIGGFAAGMLFLAFLFLVGIFRTEEIMQVSGFLFVGAAIAGSWIVDHIILDAATVCLFIIGCVLLAFGTNDPNTACCFLVVIALVTLTVTSNYILAFISVLLFNGSLASLFFINDAGQWIYLLAIVLTVGLSCICSAEATLISISAKLSRLFKPVVAGMFVSLAVCLVTVVLQPGCDNDAGAATVWILSVCIWANIFWLIHQIIGASGVISGRNRLVFYLLSALVLLPTIFAPSIAGAIMMILLSVRFSYKPAFAMSVVLLIYTLIQYYYDLGITLLAKSGILFLSGVLFLALWLVFRIIMKKDGAV